MVVLERDGSLVRNTKALPQAADTTRKRKARSAGWLGRFLGSMRRPSAESTTVYR